MRDLDTVDFELRLLAAVRRSVREHGGQPSSRHVDELLDERNELTGTCWQAPAELNCAAQSEHSR
jgi:hypothetical protein